MTRAWVCALVLACSLATRADAGSGHPDPSRFAYDQKPGARLPAGLVFRDADGRDVSLGDLPHGLPLILVPAYLRCPNLCSQVRASLLRGLQRDGLEPGRDYVLAVLSIDPTDTPADAREAKTVDVAEFGAHTSPASWHYLTGAAPDIAAVTAAVGFRNRADPVTRQFIHPAGVVFVTPDGRVASYLLGAGYAPAAIRAGVGAASVGRLAAAAAPMLLICFHFDPATGLYSLEIMKLLRLAAVLTVLVVAGTVVLLHRRERTGARRSVA